jgi:hypothetical protein
MDNGDIEVELYDHSEAAQSSFGGDVSTIYTVDKLICPNSPSNWRLDLGAIFPAGDIA